MYRFKTNLKKCLIFSKKDKKIILRGLNEKYTKFFKNNVK